MACFCSCPSKDGVKLCEGRIGVICMKKYNESYEALSRALEGKRGWGEDPEDTARRHDFQRRSGRGSYEKKR
jgi:hypothetical protein